MAKYYTFSEDNEKTENIAKNIRISKGTIRVPDEICDVIHAKNIIQYNKAVQDDCEQIGVQAQLRVGKWTKEEDEILTNNWERFISENPFKDPMRLFNYKTELQVTDESQGFSHIQKFKGETKFYIQLSKNLNRSVGSCYNRGRKLFRKCIYKQGPLSEEEIIQLEKLHKKYGNKWSLIGEKMGRSGQSLIDFRTRQVKEFNKGPWSEEETDQLHEAILKVTKAKDLSEVGFKELPWNKIAELVPTRLSEQCRHKWLFRLKNSDVAWNKLKTCKLIEIIYGLDVEEELDIDWEEIYFSEFPEVPSPNYLQRKWNETKQHVCDSATMSFEDLRDKMFIEMIVNGKAT